MGSCFEVRFISVDRDVPRATGLVPLREVDIFSARHGIAQEVRTWEQRARVKTPQGRERYCAVLYKNARAVFKGDKKRGLHGAD